MTILTPLLPLNLSIYTFTSLNLLRKQHASTPARLCWAVRYERSRSSRYNVRSYSASSSSISTSSRSDEYSDSTIGYSPSNGSDVSSTADRGKPTSSKEGGRLRFNVAAAYLGKPADDVDVTSKVTKGFDSTNPIVRWRDDLLKRHGRFAELVSMEEEKHRKARTTKKAAAERGSHRDVSAGDDFFFISQVAGNNNNGTLALGVADGVGGWNESGVDPAVFSQALMYHADRSVQIRAQQDSDIYPHDILNDAFDGVQAEDDVEAGSSTACVMTIDPVSATLRAANLGDSSFALIRSGKIVHAQPAQVHYFNCPFQLSKLPPELQNDPGSITNHPNQADLFETKVSSGDIVLLYTDGFGDNVWGKEVEILLERVRSAHGDNDQVASEERFLERFVDSLASYARLCSEKVDKVSPFEYEARRHKLLYKGGKVDDITVIAISIV